MPTIFLKKTPSHGSRNEIQRGPRIFTPPPLNQPRQGNVDRRIESLEALDPGFTTGAVLASYMALPGLVGFWPMSSVNISSGLTYDHSEQERDLTYNGGALFSYFNGLVPYVDLDGSGDFLSRADEAGLDIIGNEAFFAGGALGLTMGAWVWVDTVRAGDGIISKWGTTGASGSYMLLVAGTSFQFAIESAGGVLESVTATNAGSITTGQWYFVVGRWDPSASLDIWVQNIQTTASSAIATLRNNAIAFQVGTWSTGGTALDGRLTLAFLCANTLGDDLITSTFQVSRILFGV